MEQVKYGLGINIFHDWDITTFEMRDGMINLVLEQGKRVERVSFTTSFAINEGLIDCSVLEKILTL